MPGFHVRRSWVLLFTLSALAVALGSALVASASSAFPFYALPESPAAQATREPGLMFDPTDSPLARRPGSAPARRRHPNSPLVADRLTSAISLLAVRRPFDRYQKT